MFDNAVIDEMFLREKRQKVEKFRILNQYVKKGEILFAGSSLMEGFPVNEFLIDFNVDKKIYNRGIGGYVTEELMLALEECIFELEPSKIFINIGTNDIAQEGYTVEKLIKNYTFIISEIKSRLPEAAVYVMAYYPINDEDNAKGKSDKSWFTQRTNESITKANEKVKEMALAMDCRYIDLNKGLLNEEGKLKKEYTIEGLHMYANGYKAVWDEMLPYILE